MITDSIIAIVTEGNVGGTIEATITSREVIDHRQGNTVRGSQTGQLATSPCRNGGKGGLSHHRVAEVSGLDALVPARVLIMRCEHIPAAQARAFCSQLVTRCFCLGMWWRRAALTLNGKMDPPPIAEGTPSSPAYSATERRATHATVSIPVRSGESDPPCN